MIFKVEIDGEIEADDIDDAMKKLAMHLLDPECKKYHLIKGELDIKKVE